MTSASSEAALKPELRGGDAPSQLDGPPAAKSKRRWVWAAAGLALLLLLAAGPTLLLHGLLKSMFPAESGFSLSYGRARAGFMLSSATVEDIRLQGLEPGQGPVLSIESLKLEGMSRKNIISLFREPEKQPGGSLDLADNAAAHNLELALPNVVISLADLNIRHLRTMPDPAGSVLPIGFERLEARLLRHGAIAESLEINHLEARNLGPETLGSLSVKLLEAKSEQGGPARPVNFETTLGALNAGGLKLGALRQALRSGDSAQIFWWLLAGCETLDLAQLVFSVNQTEATAVRSALFDSIAGQGGAVNYIRRVDFSLNADLLAQNSIDPIWADLAEIAGPDLKGELGLDLDYAAAGGRTSLNSVRLDVEGLGRLELSGALKGVPAVKTYHSPYQILYGANFWRVENLALDFTNAGLATAVYRRLDRTVFSGGAAGSGSDEPLVDNGTAARIMAAYVRPLALDLEYEGGLANLPSLTNEIEVFLKRPESLRLTASPKPPLTMAALNLTGPANLANIDKYDIIYKLNLALEVNRRAPVSVAVARGLFEERMPAGPLPMNNHFKQQEPLTDQAPLQGFPDIRQYPDNQ
ncbi:hypothetical protein LJB99_03745 [Deltaproteobacteria bacterium OttesenSCG-928-K17]|nr:hypothetical protein [Deltaproteobacteria bacterium OttesenSCG-928-K17]